MLATYNEIDLPGELSETDPTNIIPFPTVETWEPDPTSPAACALCLEDGAEADTGLCRLCARRLPRVGGCGLALRLVAGLTGGDTEAAQSHLTACRDCRDFFDTLGDLARVAQMEADFRHEPAAALTPTRPLAA